MGRVEVSNLDYLILETYTELGKPARPREVARKLKLDGRLVAARVRRLAVKGYLRMVKKGVYEITEKGLSIIRMRRSN